MFLALKFEEDNECHSVLYGDNVLTNTVLEAMRCIEESKDDRFLSVSVQQFYAKRPHVKGEQNAKHVCTVTWDDYHQCAIVKGDGFPPIPQERPFIDMVVAEFMVAKTDRHDLFVEGLKFETTKARFALQKIQDFSSDLKEVQLICYHVLWQLQAQFEKMNLEVPFNPAPFNAWLPVELAKPFDYKWPEAPKYLLTKNNLRDYCVKARMELNALKYHSRA